MAGPGGGCLRGAGGEEGLGSGCLRGAGGEGGLGGAEGDDAEGEESSVISCRVALRGIVSPGTDEEEVEYWGP